MNSGEIFIRRYIYTLPLLITILLVLIVGGCGSGEEQEQSRATFVSENSFGKIEGYATGHEAGQSSAFEITIFDVPQETWQGEYCLLLVDEEGVVTQLVNRPITLAGGEEYYRQLPAQFPATLEDGVYGIMLLVPVRGSVTRTIWIGESSEQAPDSWAEVSKCS
jgi:hypothetical protein